MTFSSNNWHALFWFVTRVEILWNFPRLDFHFFLLRNVFFFFYLLQPLSLESKALKNSQLHPGKFALLWISIRQQAPFVSFFFARLGVFLEHSSGKCPQVRLFLPRSYAALRPFLVTLYPLIRHSLIKHHLEMVVIEEGDSKLRSSELEIGLSSSEDCGAP